MARLFVYIFSVILFSLVSFSVEAQSHKKHVKSRVQVQKSLHFPKNGVFIWNELCFDGNKVGPYVAKAKAEGIKFVVIKASDGCEWGVRNSKGQFQTQLSESVIRAFHKASIKCYGYGTAWLKPQSDVRKASTHAINVLHKTSADGFVFDDVFAYGSDARQTERLFSVVRKHINDCAICRKKTLAFSTFPSVWRAELPWSIPLRYCDYFLPQIYWADMRVSPAQAVNRFQQGWTGYRKNHKGIRCKIVPVASTIGRGNVTPTQIREFILACKKFGYSNLAFFRWDGISSTEWAVIASNGGKK